jgi:hypothetical protein
LGVTTNRCLLGQDMNDHIGGWASLRGRAVWRRALTAHRRQPGHQSGQGVGPTLLLGARIGRADGFSERIQLLI